MRSKPVSFPQSGKSMGFLFYIQNPDVSHLADKQKPWNFAKLAIHELHRQKRKFSCN
jgi:hypothetical protein